MLLLFTILMALSKYAVYLQWATPLVSMVTEREVP